MDFALGEDSSVYSAPPRVQLLGDSNESSVDERLLDGLAGTRKRRNLEKDFGAQPHSGSRNDEVPVQTFYSDILAGGPDVDRMPLRLERVDPFKGIDTHCAIGPAVVLLVIMSVTMKPQ